MTYDACIIGSSPISLLAAIKLSQSNQKVVVIEKEPSIGGAWSTEQIDFLNGTRIETACHLVEYYDKVYERLSKLSGVKFKVCEPQPIKLFKNHQKKTYFSIRDLFLELVQQIFLFIALLMIRSANLLFRRKIKRGKNLHLGEVLSQIKRIVIYRIRGSHRFKGIMEPEFGYQNFLEQLKTRIEAENVHLLFAEFQDVHVLGDNLLSVDLDGRQIRAKKLYLSESTEVSKDSNVFRLLGLSGNSKKQKYWHVVVELNHQNQRSIPSYIHFSGDKLFHRLTTDHHLNSSVGKSIFLLQMNKDPESIRVEDVQVKMSEVLASFQIFLEPMDFKIHKGFEREFFSSSANSMLYKSKGHGHIIVMPSIGDLAKNFAINPMLMGD